MITSEWTVVKIICVPKSSGTINILTMEFVKKNIFCQISLRERSLIRRASSLREISPKSALGIMSESTITETFKRIQSW